MLIVSTNRMRRKEGKKSKWKCRITPQYKKIEGMIPLIVNQSSNSVT